METFDHGGAHSAGAPDRMSAGEGVGSAGKLAGGEGGTGAAGGAGAAAGEGGGRQSEGGVGGAGGAQHEPPSDDLTIERAARVRYPWPRRVLGVCFRDLGGPDAEERARRDALRKRLRLSINAHWARYSALDFYGFQTCEEHMDLEVELSATAASHSDVGFPGSWTARVITLNTGSSDAEILYWFGRALGFEHELGRPANYEPCVPCRSASSCTAADQPHCLPSGFCGKVGEHESILAAPSCAGVEPSRSFSAWDIVALQRAYGRKHAGALVEQGGRCLQVSGASSAPGTPLDAYLCLRSLPNNTWTFTADAVAGGRDRLEVRMAEEQRCAEVVDAPLPQGPLALLSQRCSAGEDRQRVELGPLRLRSFGGLCVTAASASDGARVHVQGCEQTGPNSPEVSRFIPRGGRIRLADSDLCVSAPEKATLGDILELRECADSPRQQFALRDSEIHSRAPDTAGLCWDVLGGRPAPGAPVGLWNGCGFRIENNVFFATATIRAGDGCLEALPEPGFVNRPVGVSSCAESATQAWDVHW